MTGKTLRQFNVDAFWQALDQYKHALREKEGIVFASLRVHTALGKDGVPKNYKRLITQAFKSGGLK